jgi:hypothetical protein
VANREFIQALGRLRVIAAQGATITVGTRARHFQVCQVAFNKDGSIFVQCPYFPGRNGILASPSQDPEAEGPITYDLTESGKLTSHLVKLSHPPDGNVHFSQDRKILSVVRRKTFPLATTIGFVFQLHIYHPERFEKVTKTKKRRAYLPFLFAGRLPQAITVFAEWRRRRAMEANLDPANGVAGPVTEIISRKTGVASTVFFLMQPVGFALRDYVLIVGVEPTRPLPNVTEPTMILMGGFDPHEVAEPGHKARHTGLLIWKYPYEPTESLRSLLGSVDLDAQPRF